MVRLADRPNMTLDVYRGRKTTIQQQQQSSNIYFYRFSILNYKTRQNISGQGIFLVAILAEIAKHI